MTTGEIIALASCIVALIALVLSSRRDTRGSAADQARVETTLNGIATGVDYNLLMAAREALQAGLPDEPLYGMTPLAGLPKGWQPAA